MPEGNELDIEEEKETLKCLFTYFGEVRDEVDYGVVSNLLKILALIAENKAIFHESAYQRTQDKLFGLLFDCVFKEGKYE